MSYGKYKQRKSKMTERKKKRNEDSLWLLYQHINVGGSNPSQQKFDRSQRRSMNIKMRKKNNIWKINDNKRINAARQYVQRGFWTLDSHSNASANQQK